MNLSTILALLKSGSSYAVVGLIAVSFYAGMYTADQRHEKKAAEAELAHAVERAQQGKRDYERLIEAQNTINSLRADADRMRTDADRLRAQAAARKRESSSAACTNERAAIARCERLLQESCSLLGDGAELLQRNAAIHDGVIKLLK